MQWFFNAEINDQIWILVPEMGCCDTKNLKRMTLGFRKHKRLEVIVSQHLTRLQLVGEDLKETEENVIKNWSTGKLCYIVA